MFKNSIASLLEQDLEHKGMNQEQLAKLLSTPDDEISQQAISQWKTRNRIPLRRRAQLVEIFGPDSALAKYFASGRIENLPVKEQDEPNDPQLTLVPNLDHEDARPMGGRVWSIDFDGSFTEARKIEKEFQEALPLELRKYIDAAAGIGSLRRRVDYLSENLVVELKVLNRTYASLSSAAMKILVAKALLSAEGKHHQEFVILVIAPAPLAPREAMRLQDEVLDAGVVGIQVHVTRSAKDAADLVVALEEDAKMRAAYL